MRGVTKGHELNGDKSSELPLGVSLTSGSSAAFTIYFGIRWSPLCVIYDQEQCSTIGEQFHMKVEKCNVKNQTFIKN